MHTAVLLLLLACADDGRMPVDPSAPSALAVATRTPAALSVSPSSASIGVDGSVQLTASATDARGRPASASGVTWMSTNPLVATVSATGTVTGVAAGSATVIAALDALRDSAQVTVAAPALVGGLGNECAAPSPEWLWCDDFDVDRLASYFEVDAAGGKFARVAALGQAGSYAMRATYEPGTANAGNLKLAFGANPGSVRTIDAGALKFRDLYWRLFVRTQPGWTGGGGGKLSRAMVLATSSSAQAAVGHVWTPSFGSAPYLLTDPARGTDDAGTLRTTVYNDIPNFTWLGATPGTTSLFADANANNWSCVEAHMRLNDLGLSNGVFELWVGSNLEVRQTNLNWLGAYGAYGINAVFFENYWDGGSPVTESRVFDNIVVSTERIGCSGGTPGSAFPVAVIEVSGATTVAPGSTAPLIATPMDKRGVTVASALTWQSSNPAVATVSGSGVVTGVTVGKATIAAQSANGKTGSVIVTVGAAAPVNVTTTTLAGATVGVGYTQTLTATGGSGAYVWSLAAGALPAGLALNASTGAITGTPTVAGTSSFTVKATSGSGSDTQALSIAVAAPSVTVLTSSLPGGTVRLAYAQTLAASGGSGTYAWSLASGALPAGLALNASTGAITGTPTVAGTSSFTVQATSAGLVGTRALTLSIASAAGSVAPNLSEDFSTYTSTANMLSDPRNIYSQTEDIAPGQIVLDTSVGFGSSTKSMRYDYPDQTASPTRCNGATIGRNLSLAANQPEIWLEVYVRFPTNWQIYPSWFTQCSPVPNPDFKFLFGRMTQSSRFEMLFGNSVNGNVIVGYPGNEAAFTVPSLRATTYLDNQWHQYRLHFKTSGATAGSGQVELWIDGVRVANLTGITTAGGAANLIYSVALGRNRNIAAGSPQSLWWGSVKVWYAGNDPGW